MAIEGTVTATGGGYTESVVDGGFESGTIDSWTSYTESGGTAEVTTSAKYQGSYGLELTVPAYGAAQAYQNVGIVSDDYTLSFYSKTATSDGDAVIQYRIFEDGGSFNSDWIPIGGAAFTETASTLSELGLTGTSTIDLTLIFSANGSETSGITGYIDSVSLSNTGTIYIQDTSKSFTTDEHVGRTLTMTSGTAIGQSGTISTNTATILYLPSSFPIQNVTAGGEVWGVTNSSFTSDLTGWATGGDWQAGYGVIQTTWVGKTCCNLGGLPE